MWIKQLTNDNYDEFVKWSKKAFSAIDATSIPTEYVYRTLGATKALHYASNFNGERAMRAEQTWQELWKLGGCQEDYQSLKNSKFFKKMLEAILLNDITDTVPDMLYEQFLGDGRASSQPFSVIYRFMKRSEEKAQWIRERNDWVTRDPVLSSLLKQTETPEEMMGRYWQALLSSSNPSKVVIDEFLEHAKQYRDIACAACTEHYIDTFVTSMNRRVKQMNWPNLPELIAPGLRRILNIVFIQRPDLEQSYYQKLVEKECYNLDLAVYSSPLGKDYIQKIPFTENKITVEGALWAKIVERWKDYTVTFAPHFMVSWNSLSHKELLIEVERCKKYGVDVRLFTPNTYMSPNPALIGFILNYDKLSSIIAVDPKVHTYLSTIDTLHVEKECKDALGKKRVDMIKAQWDIGMFVLKTQEELSEMANLAFSVLSHRYRHNPSAEWTYKNGCWVTDRWDHDAFPKNAEVLYHYYDTISIKNSDIKTAPEMELMF